MRIGYFADGPWSHRAFELINKDKSIQIVFIVPRNDTKDQTLLKYAQANGIDYIEGVKVNSDEFFQKAQNYNCDLFVSMSYNQIFKEKISQFPPLGTINCHAGKLPFYRGRNILNWVLINDEKEFGITVHYIDSSIDTGDIILQHSFPITDDDDYSTLLVKAYEGCAVILYDSIKLIQGGNVNRIDQRTIHPVGSYFGMRIPGDEIINWNQNTRELFNFIRSISSPGPKARSWCNGHEIMINKAAIVKDAPVYKCINGLITGRTNRGYHIKTIDTLIEIYEVESDIKLKVGDRLQCKP